METATVRNNRTHHPGITMGMVATLVIRPETLIMVDIAGIPLLRTGLEVILERSSRRKGGHLCDVIGIAFLWLGAEESWRRHWQRGVRCDWRYRACVYIGTLGLSMEWCIWGKAYIHHHHHYHHMNQPAHLPLSSPLLSLSSHPRFSSPIPKPKPHLL